MGIDFQKVSYNYSRIDKSKIYAIKDIDLSIECKNDFIAICGHTGSGKSTLIQHLNALLLPTEGNIEFFGENVKTLKKKKRLKEIRKKIGLVFQFPEYQLFEENVAKEILFGPKNFGVECNVDEVMKIVGLPPEYKKKSPFNLSGGEMKRVTIASVLACDPDILVLDEPTRGLDPKGSQEILDLLKELHTVHNKTVIIVTHNMNILPNYVNRAIVMDKSKIVFDGCPSDLFRSDIPFEHNLALPDSVDLLLKVQKEFGLDIYPYKYTLEDVVNEIE